MKIRLIQLPYHLGRERTGMGMGPVRYLEAGAEKRLRGLGHEVAVETIARARPYAHEVGAMLELNRLVAEQVARALAGGAFPLVLSGDCNSCHGTLAALGAADNGVVWFDAHGDFNTPETTTSGFFDGMALATATGRCWRNLVGSIPGFEPIQERHVLLVGVRDLDPAERTLLEASDVQVVPAAYVKGRGVSAALEAALATLEPAVGGIYLHVDLDVLDPAEAPANEYAVKGGLTVEELEEAIRLLQERLVIRAAALTAYDPACDPTGIACRAGLRVMEAIAERGRNNPDPQPSSVASTL